MLQDFPISGSHSLLGSVTILMCRPVRPTAL
jgi:hypothetical protein